MIRCWNCGSVRALRSSEKNSAWQEEDKEAICMTAGDVINIPAGVKHWHGAADSWFSHLAISVSGEDTHTEWCEAVDEETYRKAVK